MIVIENIGKEFKDIVAVKDLSLKIREGEIYGLLGENGAGKTTTLRMLATMLKPTSGNAYLNGYGVMEDPEKVREQIGILFGGETGLYDRLTAWENIEYFGLLNNLSQEQVKDRIDYLTELLDMEEYINRRVEGFSKGMKQKVAIARSIVHNPKIVLFDEPTSGLDVSVTRIVHDFINTLKKEGRTIVFSSHNMGEVKKLCTKIGIINKGKLVYDGTVEEIEAKENRTLEDVFVEMVGGRDDK